MCSVFCCYFSFSCPGENSTSVVGSFVRYKVDGAKNGRAKSLIINDIIVIRCFPAIVDELVNLEYYWFIVYRSFGL